MVAPKRITRAQVEGIFQILVERAKGGDKRSADKLLGAFEEFSNDATYFANSGGLPDSLLRYVATCIKDWRESNYKNAEFWFWLTVQSTVRQNRSGSRASSAVRLSALMARGRRCRIAQVRRVLRPTEEQIRYLLSKPDDALHNAVFFG
jgi:hypothetical protein